MSAQTREPLAAPPTRWVPAEEFVDHVRHAVRGVAQILAGPALDALCTGWLVTDDLVVVPHFVLDLGIRDRGAVCQLQGFGESERLEARVEFVPAPAAGSGKGAEQTVWPILLRLVTGASGRALPLDLGSPGPGDQLLLLHHPHGMDRLQISQGTLVVRGSEGFDHDLSSATGSAGGPLINVATGRVLGMHWGKRSPTPSADLGRAISLLDMLEALRLAPAWPEIAAHHRLTLFATSTPVPPAQPSQAPAPTTPSELALLRAALTWSMDPKTLSEADREAVRPFVADPAASRWSLPADERRELVRSAGSMDTLRKAYRLPPDAGPGDLALRRLLMGSVSALSEVPEEELPYSLQAVTWLSPVVPDLPEPARIDRELRLRRVRSRLRPVATEQLWGRAKELARLRRWAEQSDPPPLLVTGIGGMGKSALVARFALDLPTETVLLWLDFDRADLAPDDAVSVLSVLSEQLAVQRGFPEPAPVEPGSWMQAARALADRLAGMRALLVLDGFEIAQHAERHDDLWGVLDTVLTAPGTRVVVSGRAPVPNLRIGGRAAATLPLEGLPPDEARAWLVSHALEEEVVRDVLRTAGGVPLLLKLTLRLIAEGGDAASIPRDLPRRLVEGYLYQRILDRVVDLRLRAVAHDALVLRKLTPDAVAAVLADRLPPGLDAETTIAGLTKEIAIVEALDQAVGGERRPSVLRLRPEVRTATLRLLEIEDANRVRDIDLAAARWYAGKQAVEPQDRLADAAEAVYHFLRAGDVAAAAVSWIDGCAELLQDADEEIPELFPEARRWLRERAGGSLGEEGVSVSPWAPAALRRIQDVLARGMAGDAVRAILAENPERGPGSPLVVFDAWLAREHGDTDHASEVLRRAGEAPGLVGWARRVVAARTAVLGGRHIEADQLLDLDLGGGGAPDGDQAMAAVAARIRLTVDIAAEIALVPAFQQRFGYGLSRDLEERVMPWDLVIGSIQDEMSLGDARLVLPRIPRDPVDGGLFAEELDRLRERIVRAPLIDGQRVAAASRGRPDLGPIPVSGVEDPSAVLATADRLLERSVRRWRLVRDGAFFTGLRDIVEGRTYIDQLQLAAVGTAAAFRVDVLSFADGRPLADVIRDAARRAGATVPDQTSAARMGEAERLFFADEWAHGEAQYELSRAFQSLDHGGALAWGGLPKDGWTSGVNPIVLLAAGPDPLEQLERRVLGLPELRAK